MRGRVPDVSGYRRYPVLGHAASALALTLALVVAAEASPPTGSRSDAVMLTTSTVALVGEPQSGNPNAHYCRGFGPMLPGVDTTAAQPQPALTGGVLLFLESAGGGKWSQVSRRSVDGCEVDEASLQPALRRELQRLRETRCGSDWSLTSCSQRSP